MESSGGLTKDCLCTAGTVLQGEETVFDCAEVDGGSRLHRPGMVHQDSPQPGVEFWAWRCCRTWEGGGGLQEAK